MALSTTQQEVADCDKRWRVVVAGRRWGKTTLAIREICKVARFPEKEVYYISPSYRMSKTIVWKKLKKKLLELRWVKKINETELSVTLKNNSVISLKGADNPDSLRGVSLSFAVFDEFAWMDPDVYDLVIRPALADQQGGALFITTPIGKSNWAYDMFCMADEYPEDWASFQYTTLQGGFVDAAEVEAARRELGEKEFNQEFNATFESYGQLVAYAWDRENNLKQLEKPGLSELHIGMDFNFSPLTACVMVKQGPDMYVIDELHLVDSHTQEIADEIKRRYPNSKITVYPDPSSRQRKTSANGQTDFTILQNAGFTVKAPLAHDAVRDRINALNARLKSSAGTHHLFVDPKCKHTIESLEKYSYKPQTQIPDKGQFDHQFDALSYAIAYIFPLKREREPSAPQRFTHR